MNNKKIKIGIIGFSALALVFGSLSLVGILLDKNKNTDTNTNKPNTSIESEIKDMLSNENGVFVGEKSDFVYYKEKGSQYKVKSGWVYVNTTEKDQVFCFDDVEKMIDKIILGDKTFKISDLTKHNNDGVSLLKALNNEYGIKIYDTEKNLTEVLGKVEDSIVEEKHSYIVKRNNLEGKAYYFNVNFNAMSEDLYKECVAEYKKATGIEDCINLTGSLMLIIYKDADGKAAGYDITINSPAYYNSFENFKANMFSSRRFDVTK